MSNPAITTGTPALRMPGATLLTRLKVYDTISPDGQRGGTPHFHFMCTEMYFVLAGVGAVEMLDHKGFSRVDLAPGSALIFSPGTIHRLINPNGDLEILVIMQNSGLPERGDNVVCFTEEWLTDDKRYTEAMTIHSLEEAYRRRDRGIEGFIQLKAAYERDGQVALDRFYRLSAERIQARIPEWEKIVERGAKAEVNNTFSQIAALQTGDIDYLFQAQHYLIHAGEFDKPGYCGHLNRYFDPATLTPEGIV